VTVTVRVSCVRDVVCVRDRTTKVWNLIVKSVTTKNRRPTKNKGEANLNNAQAKVGGAGQERA